MEIIDSHCHASPNWFEPVETVLDEMHRNGVSKTLLVQWSGEYDNSYLLECKRRFPGRFSVIVNVNTGQADALEQAEKLVEQGAEGLRLRPATRSPGRNPLAIWHKAAELGVPVSLLGSLAEFGAAEFDNLVKELPNLKIVIEHLGHMSGDGREKTAPPHEPVKKVLELAKHPNVYIKVHGLGEFATRSTVVQKPSPFSTVPALIEMTIDAFGPMRVMWGSDFPPVAGREGYRNALRLPMDTVSFKSYDDKEWVFGKTASTLWRFE